MPMTIEMAETQESSLTCCDFLGLRGQLEQIKLISFDIDTLDAREVVVCM